MVGLHKANGQSSYFQVEKLLNTLRKHPANPSNMHDDSMKELKNKLSKSI